MYSGIKQYHVLLNYNLSCTCDNLYLKTWFDHFPSNGFYGRSRTERIVRAGGCVVAVAQWQSTGGSCQRCPVLGLTPGGCQPFHLSLFRLIASKFLYFQHEARCSELKDTIDSFIYYSLSSSCRILKHHLLGYF